MGFRVREETGGGREETGGVEGRGGSNGGDGGNGGATAEGRDLPTRFFAALRMTCRGMAGGMGPRMREDTDWGAREGRRRDGFRPSPE